MTQCVLYEGRRVEALRKTYMDSDHGVVGKPMNRQDGINAVIKDINRFHGTNLEPIQRNYLDKYTNPNLLINTYTQGCFDARDMEYALSWMKCDRTKIMEVAPFSEFYVYNDGNQQRAFSINVSPKIDENGVITFSYIFEASENPTTLDHSLGLISNIPLKGFNQVNIEDTTALEADPRRDLLSRMTPDDGQNRILSMMIAIDQYNKSANKVPNDANAFLQNLKKRFDESFPKDGTRLDLANLSTLAQTLQDAQDYNRVDSSLAQYLTTDFFEKLYSFDIEPSYWIKIAEENRGEMSAVAPYIDKYLGTNFNNLDDVNKFLLGIPEAHREMFKNKIKELFLLTAKDWLSTSIEPNKDLDLNNLQEFPPELCMLSLTKYGKKLHDTRVLLKKLQINQLTPVTKGFADTLVQVQNTILQSLWKPDRSSQDLDDVDRTLEQVGLSINFYSTLKDRWPDCDTPGVVPRSDRPIEQAMLSSLGIVGGQDWKALPAEVKSEFLIKFNLMEKENILFINRPYETEAKLDTNKKIIRDVITEIRTLMPALLSSSVVKNSADILEKFSNLDMSNLEVNSLLQLKESMQTALNISHKPQIDTIRDYCNARGFSQPLSQALVLANPSATPEAKTQAARKLLAFQANLPPEPKASVAKKAALGLWIAAFVGAVVGAVALCLTGVGIPIAAAIFAPVAAAALAAVVKATKELVVEHKEIKEVKNFRDALDEIVKPHKPQNPPAAEPSAHQPDEDNNHYP